MNIPKKIILIILIVVPIATYAYVENRLTETQAKTVSLLQEQTTAQQMTILPLLEAAASNRSAKISMALVQDCSLQNKERFDALLNSLPSLTVAELQTTADLVDACGDIQADEKRVLAYVLEREIAVYVDLQKLFSQQAVSYQGGWIDIAVLQEMSELVTTQVALLEEQVEIQKEVIADLQAGKSATGSGVAKKLEAATAIVEAYSVAQIRLRALFDAVSNKS